MRRKKTLLERAKIILINCEINDENIYNLSCAFALLGNKKKALENLEKCLLEKITTIDVLDKDEDWNSIRKDLEFTKLLEKYKN